jgi:hypothetical protein
MRPLIVLAALALTVPTAVPHLHAVQEAPLPDFGTFAAEVKTRLQTDSARQSGYVFTERRVEQKLDGSGRVREERVKVYEVYPPLPGEEPYRRLIEEDGRPVPAAALEKRDREQQKKAEKYARDAARQTRAGYEKAQRAYDKVMRERSDDIDDIFNVFDVRMIGRERIGGHGTIAFTLTPRAGARPRTDSGRMMRHFTARAWISETEFELVRVEVEAVDNVSFGLGLLARLHKGATATYERRKVNGEAWLPARVTYTGSGRVLLVRRLRLGGYSEFSNYRRFSVDTTTTIGDPSEWPSSPD